MPCTCDTSCAVISCVRRICSPAACACSEPSTTCSIVRFTVLMVSFVSCWMLPTSVAICCVALRELSASRCTSSATTEKPRPASPATAACMDAFSASTWVRSEMVLIRFTIPLISCERSPKRLMRFSVSAMVARMDSMLRTVSLTVLKALLVTCVACSADRLLCEAISAMRSMVCTAPCSDVVICSTLWRSLSAVCATVSACCFTLLDTCATWPAISVTPCNTRAVSEANWLIESDTVPIMSSVTGACTVRSRSESAFTACSTEITESFKRSFSSSARFCCAARSAIVKRERRLPKYISKPIKAKLVTIKARNRYSAYRWAFCAEAKAPCSRVSTSTENSSNGLYTAKIPAAYFSSYNICEARSGFGVSNRA